MAWGLRQQASTAETLVRSHHGANCLITSCHEIGLFNQRGGRDMRLCADNCVTGFLVGCCSWVVKQDGVCIEVCWRLAICKGGPGCGQLEQKPGSQGASMEAEWATFHG